MSDLGLGYELLGHGDQQTTAATREKYAAIMQKATAALVSGGVHTPNHRWEICKALAHIHHIWPSRAVVARIDDWLGEGIDQDADGEYSERSPNYASEVTNRSLVIVARLARRPALLEHVRRNLDMTLYRLEPNGEVETVQSRRQDQTGTQDVWKYLMHYRELALVANDPRFAAVAEQILDRVAADPASFASAGYSVGDFLAEALAYPRSRGGAARPRESADDLREVLRGFRARASPPRRRHGEHLRRNRLARGPAFARSPPGCRPIRRSSSFARAPRSCPPYGCHQVFSAWATSGVTA